MKVIFLDYDGVLNNPYFLLRQKKRGSFDDFDPKRIEILREICDITGAIVVLTSTWRENKEAMHFLLNNGIPIRSKVGHEERGEAIDLWIQNQDEDVENYLIFDDETSKYSEEQMKHVICTKECFDDDLCAEYDCCMGLQEKHIKWAEVMLAG